MSISLSNNVQTAQTAPAFRGKYKQTETGATYYSTSSGTTAGLVAGTIMGLPNLITLGAKDLTEKEIENIKKSIAEAENNSFSKAMLEGRGYKGNADEFIKLINEERKFNKKWAIPTALLIFGLSTGCGMLVDKLRNKKAMETADLVKQAGPKRAMDMSDKIALSNKNRPFYESNIGSKYGAFLGAGCGLIFTSLNPSINKKVASYVGNALIYALGGWIMGKITDNNTNKDTRKHA